MTAGRNTIRRRLWAVFTASGVLLLCFGLLSFWRLSEVNAASVEIRDHWLQSTRLLGDLNNSTSDFRAAEASHLLAAARAPRTTADGEIAELTREIAKAANDYDALPRDITEDHLWRDFQHDWTAYRALADEVIRLSDQGRAGEATARYLTQSRAAYQAASDALGVLTDRTVARAQEASRRAEEVFQRTRAYILVAVGLMVLVSALVMRHIGANVLGPILDLAGRMQVLAQNRLDIETSGTERQDEIGEMARAIVVFRDNAIELAHSQRGMERQAAMLAEKLEHEQRLTDLQRNFVSMASHEFRTPLTVIDGHAQRLQRLQERGEAGPELAERLKKVRMAVRRMTHLIDRLLNSLKVFDGKAALYFHPARFDLADLLHDVCQTYREITPGAMIVEHLRKAPHESLGDVGLLYQAFSNLLSNAVKYSPDGKLVELTSHVEPGWHVITVTDQGIGIPPGDLAHVFERYHRGSNVRGVVGTGIGLYLVKMVVDLHGGSIEVESREGLGSRFVVRLPAPPEEAAAEPAREELARVAK